MQNIVSLEGPVERVDGRLVVRVPLNVGGDRLAPLAEGIGEVIGEHLVIEIRHWLAEKLQVGEGSWVVVDNRDGRFTITSSARNDTSSTSGLH